MEQAEWQAKVEKYMEILHPGYSSMTIRQQMDLFDDKDFIIENTDAIHEAFTTFSNSDSPRYMESASEQERMQKAMWQAKVEKYMEILHPGYSSMTIRQQMDLFDDKDFIIENTDAVHEAFCEFSNSDSPKYMESASEQERMQKAIEEIKVKEQNSKKITPTAAVKSALKGTTAIKSAEANGVEQSELNPEITKEGEEIDD